MLTVYSSTKAKFCWQELFGHPKWNTTAGEVTVERTPPPDPHRWPPPRFSKKQIFSKSSKNHQKTFRKFSLGHLRSKLFLEFVRVTPPYPGGPFHSHFPWSTVTENYYSQGNVLRELQKSLKPLPRVVNTNFTNFTSKNAKFRVWASKMRKKSKTKRLKISKLNIKQLNSKWLPQVWSKGIPCNSNEHTADCRFVVKSWRMVTR